MKAAVTVLGALSGEQPPSCPWAVIIKQGLEATSKISLVGFSPEIHFTEGQRHTTPDSRSSLSSVVVQGVLVVDKAAAAAAAGEIFVFSC